MHRTPTRRADTAAHTPRSGPLLIVLVATTGACSTDAEATGLPAGVRVAGLDVQGLSVTAAADRIEAAFGRQLRSRIRVRAAGHRRAATARFLRLRFDPLRSAVTRVSIRPARVGYDIDRASLRRRIAATLRHPRAPRVLGAARREITPKIRRREVLRRNRTIVTVHRRGYRLRVFMRLKQVASYPVAVGMPGHATPRGRFRIANKAVDPAWAAPDKPWAGAYRGEVTAGGAVANPLKARWLGIVDGVGIHGTAATGSLGRRASHGCNRMAVPAVKRVYRIVLVGARVLIK
jgi:lipoprotein-anchoring transpeptidase ErfK/SrfK